jgi:iron complex outermembrane receptor protein
MTACSLPHAGLRAIRIIVLACALAGWLVAGRSAANTQSTGTLEGRVCNAATGAALVNARVMIEGTTREAITDATGSFRLSDLPAGDARMAVTYIGMERETATVSVPAGGTAQREFELRLAGAPRPGEVVQLDAFNVVADREMSAQALAMNEQRHAPNIKNVVSIDEYGDRGGENIGEFLRFMPGV